MKTDCDELHAMLHDASGGAFTSTQADHDADLQSLGIDSLALHDFAAGLQKRYAVMIPDESLGRMRTLADLERVVTAELERA